LFIWFYPIVLYLVALPVAFLAERWQLRDLNPKNSVACFVACGSTAWKTCCLSAILACFAVVRAMKKVVALKKKPIFVWICLLSGFSFVLSSFLFVFTL